MSEAPCTPLQRAIDAVGGVSALAAKIGIGPSAVFNWKARQGLVPVDHCAAIELATAGKVTRKDLRPDDWQRVWPELAAPDSAPGALDEAAAT